MPMEHTGVKLIAFDALHVHDRNIKLHDQVHFYEIIDDYGGGTLLLAEFTDTLDPDDNNLYHFQVIVRGSKADVHTGWTTAYREGQQQRRSLVEQLTSVDVFTPILTLVLVFSFLYFAWDHLTAAELAAEKTLGGAITTVIGYWFGRQSRAVNF